MEKENYLILYVDVEFIVGVVSSDYGLPHLVGQDAGNDSLMWLYFFNDPSPSRHEVSYGKNYKSHFLDGEFNYYGNFLSNIENEENGFELRHVTYPLIDLLDVSGMLNVWRQSFVNVTQTELDEIPTLLTFSSSVSDLAKQRFVDYVRSKGFDVKSYTIPLSELALYRLVLDEKINAAAGRTALMLEATNSVLHFSKLTCSDEYFIKDGKVKSIKGKGIDPRKRALCRFLVSELNSQLSVLRTEEEKEQEVLRFEQYAADWLKAIERQRGDRPSLIRGLSFQRAIRIRRDILVRLSDIDSDTGRYLQNLTDEYQAFKEENSPEGVDFCCFVGNCFVSERIKNRFTDLIGEDKIFFFKTTDVAKIISCYPRIDLKGYADEEARIRREATDTEIRKTKEREAEKRLKAEQERAEKEAERLEAERQAKEDAEKAYKKALDLDKQGRSADAKLVVDTAIELVPDNLNYRKFADYLSEKITKLQGVLTLYKGFLSKGDTLFENRDFEGALVEYEKAKAVDDNAEIKGKIINCKAEITQKRNRESEVVHLFSEIKDAVANRKFDLAEEKVKEVLKLDPDNKDIQKYVEEIAAFKKEEDDLREVDRLVKLADELFSQGNFKSASFYYNQVLVLKPGNNLIIQKLKECDKILSYLSNLSNPRFVRAEIANVKAKIRSGKYDEAADQLDLLEKNLHLAVILTYDAEIALLRKDLPAVPNVVEQKKVQQPAGKKVQKPEVKSESDNKIIKGVPKGSKKPQSNFAEASTLSDREIVRKMREIKALVSTGHVADAEFKFNDLKKQLTSSDFTKHGMVELQKKINEKK